MADYDYEWLNASESWEPTRSCLSRITKLRCSIEISSCQSCQSCQHSSTNGNWNVDQRRPLGGARKCQDGSRTNPLCCGQSREPSLQLSVISIEIHCQIEIDKPTGAIASILNSSKEFAMVSHQDTEVLIGPIGEAVLRHLFCDTRLIMDETRRCQRAAHSHQQD